MIDEGHSGTTDALSESVQELQQCMLLNLEATYTRSAFNRRIQVQAFISARLGEINPYQILDFCSATKPWPLCRGGRQVKRKFSKCSVKYNIITLAAQIRSSKQFFSNYKVKCCKNGEQPSPKCIMVSQWTQISHTLLPSPRQVTGETAVIR